ncbi:MAG TPA: SulP family inorganic anion transporter [Nitrosomonas halophila]|nr:SulP family inorganic anion transporter [Nitrosomonas halophila]
MNTENQNTIKNDIPKDWWLGLKQNFTHDFTAGLLVFLLALPLSLGIAKAAEFPPAMGVLSAMIAGLLGSLLGGSHLTIKGPAAGLITITAGCVLEMGGGMEGWHLALGVMVVAGILQIVLGFMKAGALSYFFPHSAVHGMLAAIGIIIISKQIHVMLGIDPADLAGMEPDELLTEIPHSLSRMNMMLGTVGVGSLVLMFFWHRISFSFLRKIPAPMVILLLAIPCAIAFDFKSTQPDHALVQIGDFWGTVAFNPDFSAIGTVTFWKYVIMFLLIGSLESLLTVKAIDSIDPWKRESDFNKDLWGIGAANTMTACLGGFPSISEVARSSANVELGARTRWSNFFHGCFLLLAMLLFIPLIELIPNAALAAMLVFVGYRLTAPHLYFRIYKVGSEQLTIFLVTVLVTVETDLLIGIASGILIKFIFHIVNGAKLDNLFKPHYKLIYEDGIYRMTFFGAAIFSNLIGFKKVLKNLESGKEVVLDFQHADLVDHTFMEYLERFEEIYVNRGGAVNVTGFEQFQRFSNHPLSGRKTKRQVRVA